MKLKMKLQKSEATLLDIKSGLSCKLNEFFIYFTILHQFNMVFLFYRTIPLMSQSKLVPVKLTNHLFDKLSQ